MFCQRSDIRYFADQDILPGQYNEILNLQRARTGNISIKPPTQT